MSLYGLDSYSLELVLGYVTAKSIVGLWLAGDSLLRSKMRQSVLHFDLALDFCHPASLHHLMTLFSTICDNYGSLRILETTVSSIIFVRSTTDWSLLPKTLKALQLPGRLIYSGNILSMHPNLQTLEICLLPDQIDALELPETLTKLVILLAAALENPVGRLLSRLPPNLRHFHTIAGAYRSAGSPPLSLRHLPLEHFHVRKLSCRAATENAWEMFPPSLKHLTVTLHNEDNEVVEPPHALSSLFPRIVEFRAGTTISQVKPENLDIPLSLEILDLNHAPGQLKPANQVQLAMDLQNLYRSPFVIPKAHQLRQTLCSSITTTLEHYIGLESLHLTPYGVMCVSVCPTISALVNFYRLQSLTLEMFPSAKYIGLLPKTLTSLFVVAPLDTRSLDFAPTANDRGAWPPLLRTMRIDLDYDVSLGGDRRTLDLEGLPETLQTLTFTTPLPDQATDLNLLIFDTRRFPYITGTLLHMKHLETLEINPRRGYTEQIDEFAYSPLFSSPMQLPRSLTTLTTAYPNGFSQNVISEGCDPASSSHHFDKMTKLKFGQSYYERESDLSTHFLTALPLDDPHGLLPSQFRGHRHGVDTQIIHLLPPRLEELRLSYTSASQPWSDDLIKALPRRLRMIELFFRGSIIPFEGKSAACLKHLPPNLICFSFQKVPHISPTDTAQSLPADFWTCIPASVPQIAMPHAFSVSQKVRYVDYWRSKLKAGSVDPHFQLL